MFPGYGVKKKFLVQFEYGQKRDMGYFLLHICSEEGVGHKVNEPISDLPPKEGVLLTINDNLVGEGKFIF